MKVIALGVVAVALLATGCSSSGNATTSSPPAPVTSPATTTAVTSFTAVATDTPTATTTATATATATRTVTAPPSSSATNPQPSAGPAHPCSSSQLRIGRESGDGAGGTAYLSYPLVNVGARTCTLFGYPGVSVINAAGHIVQHAAVRQAGLAPSSAKTGLLRIAPGRSVTFIVAVTDTDPDTQCPGPRVGTRLRVYPPNQTVPIIRAGSYQACEARVSPVFQR